jgi:hypothetical protein
MTLFMVEMHATELKTGVKSEITSNTKDTARETMIITVPSTTNLTDSVHPNDTMKESKLSPTP